MVVGRSTRVSREVHESACRERGIPILRRSSGGAAVVAGGALCLIALVATGEYATPPEACAAVVRETGSVLPRPSVAPTPT